ncbi:replication endonuclease [Kineobactrum sediminis]|uniref:Replication endonuclease n=1 Tax=Kineobactrum sediminis TaxID=1905677 RepID=A0A2N5Y031_9GAMM|nr:replication endonuclease [Kineobactrum sediminis]PLW81709.1 replication endonuclease [Kineobactrum sediminis]
MLRVNNPGLSVPPDWGSVGPAGAPVWHETGTSPPRFAPNDKLRSLGTAQCHTFRNRLFQRHSDLAWALSRDYLRIAKERDYVAANRRLLDLDARLSVRDLKLTADHTDLKAFASHQSQRCYRYACKLPAEAAHQRAAKLAKSYRLEPPSIKQGIEPSLARLCDQDWWLRQVKRLQKCTVEGVRRDLGEVRQGRSCYASTEADYQRQMQKAATRDYLSKTTLRNGDGDELNLLEVYEHSIANPAVRRAELMTRIKGFELLAEDLGDDAEFYTISAPGYMHAYRKSGQRNPNFQGHTPADIQNYLNATWRLIRSALHRRGIQPYGFRVVEPHHDGTPHWHLLLFMPPEHVTTCRKIMRHYALLDKPEERGARKHRFKAVPIDRDKGSAAGYIAKYVAKNIDGAHLETDLYGSDAITAARKIEAWASNWGIRQFQQIGGPSVTVWRELRRIDHCEDPEIESARRHADAGDWAAFCLVMRGGEAGAAACRIRIAREPAKSEADRYGAPQKPKIIGVRRGSVCLVTRLQRWVRVPTLSPTHVNTTQAGRVSWPQANLPSRTCVNNCTGQSMEPGITTEQGAHHGITPNRAEG